MIKLNLSVPLTIRRYAVNQSSIPCHCLIGREDFKIIFSEPIFDATGVIDDWDTRKFDTIVPALAGGEYTHDNFATLTLRLLEESIFEVINLELFDNHVGWISVVKDGKYSDVIA